MPESGPAIPLDVERQCLPDVRREWQTVDRPPFPRYRDLCRLEEGVQPLLPPTPQRRNRLGRVLGCFPCQEEEPKEGTNDDSLEPDGLVPTPICEIREKDPSLPERSFQQRKSPQWRTPTRRRSSGPKELRSEWISARARGHPESEPRIYRGTPLRRSRSNRKWREASPQDHREISGTHEQRHVRRETDPSSDWASAPGTPSGATRSPRTLRSAGAEATRGT